MVKSAEAVPWKLTAQTRYLYHSEPTLNQTAGFMCTIIHFHSVAVTYVYKLLKECGHMWPPPNWV